MVRIGFKQQRRTRKRVVSVAHEPLVFISKDNCLLDIIPNFPSWGPLQVCPIFHTFIYTHTFRVPLHWRILPENLWRSRDVIHINLNWCVHAKETTNRSWQLQWQLMLEGARQHTWEDTLGYMKPGLSSAVRSSRGATVGKVTGRWGAFRDKANT